jgi:hypothetical protein
MSLSEVEPVDAAVTPPTQKRLGSHFASVLIG